MAKRKNPFTRIRLVYRRSSPLLKCVVLATIALSTAALLSLGIFIRNTRQQTEELRLQAAKLQEENQQLEQDIADIGTIDSIKKIAMEELGLVDPDVVIFDPAQSEEQP